MASLTPKLQVLSLYKNLLRESAKFSSYNFRLYFLRRVKDGFRESRAIQDQAKINVEQEKAKDLLEVLKRQVVIQNMFEPGPLVIEK